jgi:hypothetical protein
LLGVKNELAAYLFDGAVVTFGNAVENALQETFEIGSGDTKKTIQKYTLKEILSGRMLESEDGGSGDLGILKKSGFYEEVNE